MNDEKKHSLEQMYAAPEKVVGSDEPENPGTEIGKPEHKAKWPVVVFIIIIFLLLIIGAIVTGFFVFL